MAESVALVDTLNSLLDATRSSIFRFMDESSPYLSQATAEVRRPLAEMVRVEQVRARELAEAIDALGGALAAGAAVRNQEKYLEHLSLKFLLPKLVREKTLQIQRYESAMASIPKANPRVRDMLEEHIRQMREELDALEHAAADVIASSRKKKPE